MAVILMKNGLRPNDAYSVHNPIGQLFSLRSSECIGDEQPTMHSLTMSAVAIGAGCVITRKN
jgi:hypothetical protein